MFKYTTGSVPVLRQHRISPAPVQYQTIPVHDPRSTGIAPVTVKHQSSASVRPALCSIVLMQYQDRASTEPVEFQYSTGREPAQQGSTSGCPVCFRGLGCRANQASWATREAAAQRYSLGDTSLLVPFSRPRLCLRVLWWSFPEDTLEGVRRSVVGSRGPAAHDRSGRQHL